MFRFSSLIRRAAVALFALIFACSCTTRPKGEDFNLGVGIGMKLNAKEIEKRLKKLDPSAFRFAEPGPTEPDMLIMSGRAGVAYCLGEILVSFGGDNSIRTVDTVTVFPSPELVKSSRTSGATTRGRSMSEVTRTMSEAAKKGKKAGFQARTARGICVGSSESELKSAYGEPSEPAVEKSGLKLYVYRGGQSSLSFTVAEGTVIGMQLLSRELSESSEAGDSSPASGI